MARYEELNDKMDAGQHLTQAEQAEMAALADKLTRAATRRVASRVHAARTTRS
ncbi:MAG: hypothetical protein HY690_18890 [Chloroflexi bacterium]|nr:hypothetical protein [Chloroflexota bacterium]